MLKVSIENAGDLATIECAGGIVGRDAAFKLRHAVASQDQARTIVLEFTEVNAIEDWGLDMLLYLQRWTQSRNVRLKLFNPSKFLLDRLKKSGSMSELKIATLDEMIALLGRYGPRYSPPTA
jgi:anti-anti-sigma regulatory factor